jgi:prepilin-type N-terminal cleavage/methylation domain-containing protein
VNLWLARRRAGAAARQGGFTLVELLIVVAILGILAGIVTLSLIGLTGTAKTQACTQELTTVQTAMDAYIAAHGAPQQVTAQGTATNDMQNNAAGVALYNPNPTSTNASYTRNPTTQQKYTWDQYGKVQQAGCN